MSETSAALASFRLVFSESDLRLLKALREKLEAAHWQFHLDASDAYDLLAIVPPTSTNGDAAFNIAPAKGGYYVMFSADDDGASATAFPTLRAALEVIKSARHHLPPVV